MVSHPETGSDSSIGSDRDRGRDNCQPLGEKLYLLLCRRGLHLINSSDLPWYHFGPSLAD